MMEELKCLALSDSGAGEEALSAVIIEQDLSRVPERLLILPRGELRWRKRDKEGTLLVDDAAIASVQKEFTDRGVEMVVDYEHQTQNSQDNGRPAPAAGWIKELVADGAGLWGLVKWTKEAAGYLADGAYKYTSPFLFWSKDQRVRRVATIALTNFPATVDANSIVLRYDANSFRKEDKEMEFLKRTALRLGLAETATEDEVMAAQEKALNKDPVKVEVIPPDTLKTLGLKDGATVAEVNAALKRLKETPADVVSKEDFDSLKAEVKEKDWTNNWDLLLRDCVAMPHEADDFRAAFDAGQENFDRFVKMARDRRKFRLTDRLTSRAVPTDTGKKLEALALKAMETDKGLTYQAALLKVSDDNRDLSAGYLAEQRGAQPRHSQSAG